MLQSSWKCIFSCIPWFLYFSKKLKKSSCIGFVCLSMQALILVQNFQMSRNLYMLIISDIEWSLLKMLCMRLRNMRPLLMVFFEILLFLSHSADDHETQTEQSTMVDLVAVKQHFRKIIREWL